jgi:nitrite reductase/ring-hydroxylating ferredoxin subunit
VSDPIGDAVRAALARQPLKDLLSGTWLGHPLHPLLTDLPIGFWTSAFTLDLLGGRHSRRAATRLVAWGVLTAIPTAASGAADWGDTTDRDRRIGFVHAAANSTALACYAASWLARRRGRHTGGVLLGFAGATAATVGGFLGGHLLQTLGVGVDRTAHRRPPQGWTRVAALDDITDEPRRFVVAEAPVLVFRSRGALVALDARCPHRGAPMEEATRRDGCLVCPWHGSTFREADGTLVRGPSTVPLPSYEARVRGDDVEVRAT